MHWYVYICRYQCTFGWFSSPVMSSCASGESKYHRYGGPQGQCSSEFCSAKICFFAVEHFSSLLSLFLLCLAYNFSVEHFSSTVTIFFGAHRFPSLLSYAEPSLPSIIFFLLCRAFWPHGIVESTQQSRKCSTDQKTEERAGNAQRRIKMFDREEKSARQSRLALCRDDKFYEEKKSDREKWKKKCSPEQLGAQQRRIVLVGHSKALCFCNSQKAILLAISQTDQM